MNFNRQVPDDHWMFVRADEDDKPGEPNYQRKIRHLTKKGILSVGQIALIDIVHDGWCAIYGGGCCDCDPDIVNRITGRKLG